MSCIQIVDNQIARAWRRALSFAGFTVLFAAICFGQAAATGTISGHVSDASGAPVPGASVVATNLQTGARYTAASSSDGLYTLQFLQPGRYSVEASQTGFQKVVQPRVDVVAASNPTVNLTLSLGAVSQTVNVSSRVSLVEFENSDRSGEIDQARTMYTPTTGRVISSIFPSVPGVFNSGGDKGMVPSGNSGATQFTINGGQDRSNQMLIDGVPNRVSMSSFTFGLIPTQEQVAEFKVVTNPYSAEYGSTTGGVINVITKSGTNDFHGEAFTYIRNTVFDANQFERNLAGQSRLDLKYNNYGGVVSGPVIKNRLFFTFFIQKNRAVNPKPLLGYVPTDAQRQGDFSTTYYNKSGTPAPITIYDPFSTTFNAATGRYNRLPFAGSVIPANRINPVAKNIWQYIPEPNVPPTNVYPQSNYIPSRSGNQSTLDFLDYMPRVDWNISERSKLMVRYARNTDTEWQGLFYNTPAEPNGSSPYVRDNDNFAIDYTRTLSPTSVLDVRAGMERFVQGQTPALRGKATPKDLGFSPTFISEAAPDFPYFTFAGANLAWLGGNVFSGAGSLSQNYTINQLNNVDVNWSKVFGRHDLKIGGQFLPERIYSVSAGYDAGAFTFSSADTAGPDPQIQQAGAGSELASFLLGVGTGYIDRNSEPARQVLTESLFIQDSIKVSRKLTLNVGLRWDHEGSLTDRFNAMTGIFNPAAASPLGGQVQSAAGAQSCAACANLRGGLTFPGVNGASRAIFDAGHKDFGPRIAAAYALDSKSVLRVGYGYFYGPIGNYDPGSAGFSQPTPWNAYNADQVPVNPLDNPFPTGVISPVGAAKGLATNIGTSISFIDPDTRTPRSRQFSFELQREVPWGIRLSAAYVNNVVDRLPVSRNLNALTEAQFVQGSAVLNQKVANPFAGLAPGYTLNQSTIAVSSLIVPFPQFTSVTELEEPIGSSRYDAAQFYAVKQFSDGISFSIAYTIAKTLQRMQFQYPTDPTLEKTLSTFDTPQTLVPNFSVQLPFGRDRHFGSGLPRWLDAVVGGWQMNGLIRIQKGLPVVMNTNAIPTGADPNAVSGGQNLNHWINPAAFVYNTNPYAVRRWPIILSSLRSPPIHRFDLGLTKRFHITERIAWELEAEAPNVFNTPEFWNAPHSSSGLDPRSPLFGVIAGLDSMTNVPRQLQVGSRIVF